MQFLPLYPVERDQDHASARRAIRDFLASGDNGERHSVRGLLLHHVLNHCLREGIGFTLEYSPATGYLVRRRRAGA